MYVKNSGQNVSITVINRYIYFYKNNIKAIYKAFNCIYVYIDIDFIDRINVLK